MGWWRERTGDLIGDAPADRVSGFLSRAGEEGPLALDTVLGAIDRALRRNPPYFVADPESVDGQLAAHPASGPALWQTSEPPGSLVEGCHDALEEIAVDYLDNSLETLPTCAELLATFRFVLAPLVPGTVTAPPEFELRRIAYETGDRRLVTGVPLSCLEVILADFGLSRDPDALPQRDPPEFASWTRHPDLSLEVDWHAQSQEPAYVEIRGIEAPRLASMLAGACGGTVARDPEEALTELLTVPQRAAPADAGAAEARWEMLCVAVAGEGVFDDLPGRALVSAGLADSDWRVRMVALWAVGHHRMGGLAAKAEAAALPKSGYEGLSQDDRRVLLALRDLAAARSAGRGDPVKPGANVGFVARIAALLDRVPRIPDNRAEALVMALLRRPAPKDAPPVPSAWKRWMATPVI
jgi:hypothetical protein